MLIAQISDTHIVAPETLAYGVVDTRKFFAQALEALHGLPQKPDLVIVTGDLTDHGTPEEYSHLKALLRETALPIFLINGNHDDRDTFLESFADVGYLPAAGNHAHYVIEDWPVRIVMADSTMLDWHAGEFCEARCDWLDRTLAADRNRPTIVALHHPPFMTGISWMDGNGVAWADGLRTVIARHPQVKLVTCGHIHRPIQRLWANTLVSTCPSTAHQVDLALITAGARDIPGWNGAARSQPALTLEPPGLQLHLWDGEAIVTHTGPTDRGYAHFNPVTPEVAAQIQAILASGRRLTKADLNF